MIKIILLFIPLMLFNFACSSSSFTSEEEELINKDIKSRTEKDDVIIKVDKMPEPVGGISAIQEKLHYPEEARKNNIEGKVIIQCKITKDGSVTDLKVLKGIGYGCNEEAMKAISDTRFYPGEQNNKKVDVITAIPLLFRLK